MQADDEVQHLPRHLKLHVECQRLPLLLEVDSDVWSRVDDREEVAGGKEAHQFHCFGRTPLARGAVWECHINLEK